MLKFIDRVQTTNVCTYINLGGEEKRLYRGCGWALASVTGGKITALEYLGDIPMAAAEGFVESAVEGNKWLGMCSAYQFCVPRRIHLGDIAGIARIRRLIGEMESG